MSDLVVRGRTPLHQLLALTAALVPTLLACTLLVLGGPAAPAHACSCQAPSMEEALAEAELVAEGTVETIFVSPGDDYTAIWIKLDRSWKGEPEYRAISFGIEEGDCPALSFEEGDRLIVWGENWSDSFRWIDCGPPAESLEAQREFLTDELGEPSDLSHVPEFFERPTGGLPPEEDDETPPEEDDDETPPEVDDPSSPVDTLWDLLPYLVIGAVAVGTTVAGLAVLAVVLVTRARR
ncbi:hypothetical protein [Brachybacterium timonense]|uniref:hypothetical protein n=1 Tax=Brachybacterium timonense TaxID=2050896 RepID=UPI00110DB03D|nr:hypothetical protein [Brachybacterium timonense]